VQAAGREPDQNIAGCNFFRVDDVVFFQDANREPCKIVFARWKITGVFGGLTADQGATRLAAAGGNTAHGRFSNLHVELAAGEIVQEKKRRGALGQNVIYAHGDEIDANCVVNTGQERDFKFRADAISG